MQNKKIHYIIASITIAILGLAIIQIYWISNEVELEKRRFDRHVYEALNMAGRRIEKISLIKKGSVDPMGDLKQLMEQIMLQDSSVIRNFFGQDSSSIKQSGVYNNKLMEDMLNDIARQQNNIKRIPLDSVVLFQIIKTELQNHGIEMPFQFLFGNPKKKETLVVSNPKNLERIVRSPYQAAMFSSNVFSEPDYLIIYFPHKNAYLLKTIWATLIVSVLFIIIIIFAFYYSIRTIFNQKKLSEIKNDFINNVTHELKTPVATISLASEALSNSDIVSDPAKVSRYTNVIKDETRRLQTLIETVLTSSVTEKVGYKLKMEEISIYDLLHESIERARIPIESKNGQIELVANVKDVIIAGDYLHLSNAFYNLIDNAVKYCNKEPYIKISMQVGEEIKIEVSDNGIGMEPEELPRIFDSMYRVPTGNVHDVKGFGLGLSYCKNVIERHGGRIIVSSIKNIGSTFTVTLPLPADS